MKKLRFLTVFLILIVLMLVFPQKVKASEQRTLFFYDGLHNDDGINDPLFISKNFDFIGEFSEEDMAFIIYSNLFERDGIRFLPENTVLISVKISDETLSVDVSKEIRAIGGSAFQICLLKQLIENARQFDVTYFTLKIEGMTEFLSEGIISENMPLD